MTYFRLFASSVALLPAALPCHALEWRMPEMPDSLRTVEQRAGYLAEHYWDSVDWSEAAQAGDSETLEGVFADYCMLLPLLPDGQRTLTVKRTLDEALNGKAGGYEVLMNLAGTYLWQTDSPVYDEEAYRPFVEYGLRMAPDDEVLRHRMAELSKNSVGTPGADMTLIPYTAGEGVKPEDTVTLYSTLCQGGPTILIFYSPECGDCHEQMVSLAGNAKLGLKLSRGEMGVTAVYIGDDEEAWRRDASQWPAAWHITMSADPDDESYSVRRTPTVYLLAPDGTVVKRNAASL